MKLDTSVVSAFVQVGRHRTHYVQAGQGETVVLVHGAGPGASGWSGWRQTIPALAKRYNVIAIDTLGFGYTDKPTDIVYADQVSVDHLGAFFDVLCLGRVHLIGNSRGAYIAAKYTLDHPDRVKSLVMVSSGSVAAAMGLERNEQQSGGRNKLASFDGTAEAMRGWMEVIVTDHSKITEELIAERLAVSNLPGAAYAQKSQREYRKTIKSDPNEFQRFDLRHRLPHLTIPQMMVWGAKDAFAPPTFAGELEKMLPNVAFRVLENSGHQAQNDESDRFNEMVLAFLAGVPDAPASGPAGH
jgi:pimeloyl-ACP methyl ester carboxylesterase